jgi:hypothetical protein
MLRKNRTLRTIGVLAASVALVAIGISPAHATTKYVLCESPSSSYGAKYYNSSGSGTTTELRGHQCGNVSVRIEVFNGSTWTWSSWASGTTYAERISNSGCVARSQHDTGVTSPIILLKGNWSCE